MTRGVFGEFGCYILSVSWRSFAIVYCDIENFPFDATSEIALGKWWNMKVESSHHSIAGHRFVVLHEVDLADFFFEFSLGEAFEEVASGILEDTRFDSGRCAFLVFFARGVVWLFAEDIIGRDLHEPAIYLFHCDGEILRSYGVEFFCECVFSRFFCSIDPS